MRAATPRSHSPHLGETDPPIGLSLTVARAGVCLIGRMSPETAPAIFVCPMHPASTGRSPPRRWWCTGMGRRVNFWAYETDLYSCRLPEYGSRVTAL